MKARRVGLKDWLELSEIMESMTSSNTGIGEKLIQYLRISAGMTEQEERLPWYEAKEVFLSSQIENKIRKTFPILDAKEKSKDIGWDYEGRQWYYWANLFSSSYGWGLDVIASLDIDDAIGLMQEIAVDTQAKAEFQHSLSEISYQYDKGSKKSKYVPMKRPKWMMAMGGVHKEAPKRKILRKLMPHGVVERIDYENTAKNTRHSGGI